MKGYECQLCATVVHDKCYEKILTKCTGNTDTKLYEVYINFFLLIHDQILNFFRNT